MIISGKALTELALQMTCCFEPEKMIFVIAGLSSTISQLV
jgi:hypothetical protein